MSEPQHNLTVDSLEVVDGRQREAIEGWIPELASEADLRDALEKAFDYRGDVTITRKDGSRVEGYIFDRRNGATLSESVVRLIPQNSQQKVSILTPTSRRWPSAGATRPQARAGKPGSANIGRRKLPARKASDSTRRSWTRGVSSLLLRPFLEPRVLVGFSRTTPASALGIQLRYVAVCKKENL